MFLDCCLCFAETCLSLAETCKAQTNFINTIVKYLISRVLFVGIFNVFRVTLITGHFDQRTHSKILCAAIFNARRATLIAGHLQKIDHKKTKQNMGFYCPKTCL